MQMFRTSGEEHHWSADLPRVYW